MKSVILLFIYAVTILAVCRSADNDIIISDTNLYVSKVNNLNIRETPDLKGKVIGRLMSYEEAEFMNEKSNHVTTVDVDDEMIEAAWVKIKTKSGIIGWVWEGYLAKVKKFHDTTNAVTFNFPDTFVYYVPTLRKNAFWSTDIEMMILRKDINTLEKKVGDGVPQEDYYEDALREKKALANADIAALDGISQDVWRKLHRVAHNNYALSYLYNFAYTLENVINDYNIVFYKGNIRYFISLRISGMEMAWAMPRYFHLIIDDNELRNEILPRIVDKRDEDFINKYFKKESSDDPVKQERLWKILKNIRYKPKAPNSFPYYNSEREKFYSSLNSIELKGAARDWYYGYHYILRTLEVGK